MQVRRAIILAAGQGFQLDGVNKVLIRHPKSGKTILQHAVEAFEGFKITVVVGYRAIQIMEEFPELDFVVNPDWALTSNAMSLGLALTDEPTYVVSGDIFFYRNLIQDLDKADGNLVLTDNRENRSLTSVHCVLKRKNQISETYQGAVRDIRHPEAVGLFKISNQSVLKEWKKTSILHGNLFVGQTLPTGIIPIKSHPLRGHFFDEINTSSDYLRLLNRDKVK